MNNQDALLEKLASTSLRLNTGLIFLTALVLLLLGVSCLGIQRMIEEQRDFMSFHFARLMENIHEQEEFLKTIREQSTQGRLRPAPFAAQPTPISTLGTEPNIYEGREFSYSVPYRIKLNSDRVHITETDKIFALAEHLATYYSAFWSASHYQSPQVLLFNGQGDFDISVPAAGHLRNERQFHYGAFVDAIHQIESDLHEAVDQPVGGQVRWKSYDASSNSVNPSPLIAYIHIDLAPELQSIQGASSHVLVASLLNLSQIDNIERLMQWTIYDHLTLVEPSGKTIIGRLKAEKELTKGLGFTSNGLVVTLTSPGEHHWTAIYVIGFSSAFGYALWPFLCLFTLALAGLGGGCAFKHWYRTRVVLPAHQAHARIAESEAFSRAVIDTAPIGLCVVRRDGHDVLLENQRAQEWGYTYKLVNAIKLRNDLTGSGHVDFEIDGRHLHVAFVPARYQGQDACLCAFHDVTRHFDDAEALKDARQAAESANEAKTRFLATISHEIRTPLYGVLGTLELLGLTTLQPRQQAYLHTIRRSSATLFQLISNVLDVSKIEAEQMTIEDHDFCPLELTEDTLRTFSASAQAKGLQLYACIDEMMPDRLRGDPIRIRQLLNNLLSNAIKFTDNGNVVLRAKVLESTTTTVRLQWQVSDTGSGISQAQQMRLFDPFYQADDSSDRSGAGLGLAICKWLCELMGGQLNVVSEHGSGSSFTLQLPLMRTAGTLGDCPAFDKDAPAIYVRSQVEELAQHYCTWLKRFGLKISHAPPVYLQSSMLLLDLLPAANVRLWPGTRIIATAGGANPPEVSDNGWEADINDVRAVAWAIYFAQKGATGAPPPSPHRKNQPLNLHILVAEDNVINSAIIKEQLEALGCSVVLAADGQAAISQWEPGRYDLVLTDVNMPIMNGYQLADALRQQDTSLPIIGITANALREEGERCSMSGMNAWMVKPLDLAGLRALLVKHCNITALSSTLNSEDRPPPKKTIAKQLQLSPTMRELFVRTLRQDTQATLAALDSGDIGLAAQKLHSMAGALGAVRAEDASTALVKLEHRLTGLTVASPSIDRDVRQQLNQLCSMLDGLE